MFYVYEDWTTEEIPRCFYVGKGLLRRVHDLKRNKKHTNVALKHGLKRVIVEKFVDEKQAFMLEERLIAERSTFMTDIGCNFTRGGEGVSGPSKRKGTKLPATHCENISLGKRGKPTHWSRPKSEAFKAMISAALTGIKRSEETRKKIALSVSKNGFRNYKAIDQLTLDNVVIASHVSLKDALSSVDGKTPAILSACCNGKRESAYNFKWRWA